MFDEGGFIYLSPGATSWTTGDSHELRYQGIIQSINQLINQFINQLFDQSTFWSIYQPNNKFVEYATYEANLKKGSISWDFLYLD